MNAEIALGSVAESERVGSLDLLRGIADRSGIGGYWSLDIFDDLLAVAAEVLSLRAARVAVAFPGLPVSAANAANMTGCRASLFLRS